MLRVMIVEDDEQNRDLLTEIAQNLNHETIVAESVQEANSLLQALKVPPHLLITDLQCDPYQPKRLAGFEFAELFTAKFGLPDDSVVVITGNAGAVLPEGRNYRLLYKGAGIMGPLMSILGERR